MVTSIFIFPHSKEKGKNELNVKNLAYSSDPAKNLKRFPSERDRSEIDK